MVSNTPPPEADDKTDGKYVRPFADVLRELSRGDSHDELSEALHDLIERVTDTRKTGTIVYTIKVGPMKGTEDALLVSDQIKLKLPEHDRQSSIFYADDHGNLSRSDPNQLQFDSLVQVANNGERELVDIGTGETTKATTTTKKEKRA